MREKSKYNNVCRNKWLIHYTVLYVIFTEVKNMYSLKILVVIYERHFGISCYKNAKIKYTLMLYYEVVRVHISQSAIYWNDDVHLNLGVEKVVVKSSSAKLHSPFHEMLQSESSSTYSILLLNRRFLIIHFTVIVFRYTDDSLWRNADIISC